jgi:hypothetical protein
MSKFDLERNSLLNEPFEYDKQVFTKIKIEEMTEESINNSYFIFNFFFFFNSAKNEEVDEINYDPKSLSKEGGLMMPKIQLKN